MDHRIGKAEGGNALVVHDAGAIELLEGLLGENAVVRDGLDVQEATVGRKADLPESGEVPEAFADIKILGVVNGRLGAQRLTFFVVLLDARTLIVNVHGWNDAIGDDAGPKTTKSAFGHSAVEDQLYLFGSADVQVFADHILEEDPAADGTIPHLDQGKFDLQDGDLVSVASLPVSSRHTTQESEKFLMAMTFVAVTDHLPLQQIQGSK